MYPYDFLPGINLYTICLCLAAISAIVVYRIMADKLKIGAKLQNLCIFTAFGAIVAGYFSAIVFQAFYNVERDGKFVINNNTGATFFGGLIGGAAIFLIIYFLAGNKIFVETQEHKKRFFDVADIAACSITVAHAIGRIGCLMAGCCHGKQTSAWFGVNIVMDNQMVKVIPTQLFETIFLLALFAYLFMRIRDKQTYCLQIYMCMYGVWRFIIEYLRDDYRGTTIIDILTPSQLTSIIMIIAGFLLILFQKNVQSTAVADGKEKPSKTSDTAVAEDDEYDYDYDYGVNSEEESAADPADSEAEVSEAEGAASEDTEVTEKFED